MKRTSVNPVLAFLILLSVTFSARAAENTNGGFFSNLEITAQQIGNKFNSDLQQRLGDAGMQYANGLIPFALIIAGGLALVYLMYETLSYLGSSDGSFIQRLFDIGIPAVIAGLLITNYANQIAAFDQDVLSHIRAIGGSPAAKVMQFYASILAMIGNSISEAWTAIDFDWKFWKPELMVLPMVDFVLTIIFCLGVVVIVFSSMAEILGLLLLAPFLYAIAVALGPILISGIVTPWTREYFTKWLGFLIGSAVLAGVLSVVISLAITVFESMGLHSFVEGQSTASKMAMVAIILMAVNNLISQAPSISSALIPGSLGASRSGGSAGFSKAKEAGKKGAGGAAKSAMKTGGLAKGAYQKMSGARAAKAAAKAASAASK